LKIKKRWVTFLKEQKFVNENKESSKLFYFAACVQQVKLKGKNATYWEHHKEP
jgi:hypothetical protein